jgi:transcriptional regulator with XRE-family HTH domain
MDNIELGKQIKVRREALKLSISKVSDYTGLSRTTISDIELGKVNPTFNVLKKLFEILDLDFEIKIKHR